MFLNLSDLIERRGLNCIGFHTLTFKENLTDRKVAQERFNSYATNFLRERCLEYIAAVERQKRGAIHYHIVIAFPADIRSGFDFEAAKQAAKCKRAGLNDERRHWERVYYSSANDNLRQWWQDVREAAEKYGFGRCETLPVLSNSDGIAYYVGGYVASEWHGRKEEDKGLRTIRYGLERRAATIRWAWAEGAGANWRWGCEVVAGFLRIRDFVELENSKWAWELQREIKTASFYPGELLGVPLELRGDTLEERLRSLKQLCLGLRARAGMQC